MSGFEFRYVYENPDPIPASDWSPVEHGATIPVPSALLAVQYRETGKAVTEQDAKSFETLLINMAIEASTDADGYLIGSTVDPKVRAVSKAAREEIEATGNVNLDELFKEYGL